MFVIFIVILQQVDGNIIGPKILGSSTGLSGIWVLFSILLFGGLFGFVGMIIGVPVFAVIYDLIRQLIIRQDIGLTVSKMIADGIAPMYGPKNGMIFVTPTMTLMRIA